MCIVPSPPVEQEVNRVTVRTRSPLMVKEIVDLVAGWFGGGKARHMIVCVFFESQFSKESPWYFQVPVHLPTARFM